MLNLDMKALNDRLSSGIDTEALQTIVQNQPPEDLDESRIYTRWVIDPGASDRAEMGNYAALQQLGSAMFQIIAPEGTYQEDAYDVRQQFVDLFRDWRSDDRALKVFGFQDSKQQVASTVDQPGYLMLVCRFNWRSHRRG